MKPRTPIKRSPLPRPTLVQAIRWETRQREKARKRGRIKPLGRRGKRLEASWRKCKAAVISRSGGWCEGNIANVCPPWKHGAVDVHHVWPEDRAAGVHDPARCLHLCRVVHDWADQFPLDAKAAGILRPDRVSEIEAAEYPSLVETGRDD